VLGIDPRLTTTLSCIGAAFCKFRKYFLHGLCPCPLHLLQVS
jgi:hypothetical protein